MATRQRIDHHLQLELTASERAAIREELVLHFLKELPGDTVTAHRYRYDVEELQDGGTIYLLRPTFLNKGMDFEIRCTGFHGSISEEGPRPSHDELLGEVTRLLQAPGSTDGQWVVSEVRSALGKVWRGTSPLVAVSDSALKGRHRLSLERILKLAKWMFIEQDVTYWNYSGRWMLRTKLETAVGAFE